MKLLYNVLVLVTMCHVVSSAVVPSQEEDNAINYQELFRKFKKTYKKHYSSEEENEKRYNIFLDNMKEVEIRQKNSRGKATYGVTQFSDLTNDEFRKTYLGLNLNLGANIVLPKAKTSSIKIPKQFDWRKENKISEVKNQGQCRSCWAFSTTGNIEGLWAIQKNESITLSEQELIDCDTIDDGCGGGLMTNAYKAIISLGGLDSEADYPYEAEKGKCRINRQNIVAKISGGVSISPDEEEMARWLYENGPISIGLNGDAMKNYRGGIDHPSVSECNPDEINHGVLIVGYGVEDDTPFWIIKNSWGPQWGEDGYYRVLRGDNTCGLNRAASSAVL